MTGSYPINMNTVGLTIENIRSMADSAKHRAIKAYDAEDIRSFEYWTGRYDALLEAVDMISAMEGTIAIRMMATKEAKE